MSSQESNSAPLQEVKIVGIGWFERAWYMFLAFIRTMFVVLACIGIFLLGVSAISESGIRVVQRVDQRGCPTGIYVTNHATTDAWVIKLWENAPQDDQLEGEQPEGRQQELCR